VSLKNPYSCRKIGRDGRVTLPGRDVREHDIAAGDAVPARLEDGTLIVRFEPHRNSDSVDAELALPVSAVGNSLGFTIPAGLRLKFDLNGGESMCTRPLEDGNGIAYPLANAVVE
jgi:bifunctional DNA-binding transcriptional regulator/antitoxin component of YhaV-PrlF toxin-antitoxin module